MEEMCAITASSLHPNRGSKYPVFQDLGLGFWVIVIIVLVFGKYMVVRYLDP